MDWQALIARLLAGEDESVVRQAPFPQPRSYPGQQGALQAPLPQRNLPPSWDTRPPPVVRDDRGAPIQHWEQQGTGYALAPRLAPQPTHRTSPGDLSPGPGENFADWVNRDAGLRLPEVGGQPEPWGMVKQGQAVPESAPNGVPLRTGPPLRLPGTSGGYVGYDEDLTRLQMQEDQLFREALERIRNRSQRSRSDTRSQLGRDRTGR